MNRSDDHLDHAGSALAEPDAAQDDSAAKEVERLREDNERLRDFLRQGSRREDRLRAENAILRACAEHYANPENHSWMYVCKWTVAQEALAKARAEGEK